MKTEIKKLIESRVNANKTYSQILQILLVLDHAEDKESAEKLLAEAGVEKEAKPVSVEELYTWLESEPRSESDLKEFIKNMSKTNIGIFSFHNRTRKLVNRLLKKAEKAGSETESEPNPEAETES